MQRYLRLGSSFLASPRQKECSVKDFGNLRRHIWAIPFELVMVGGAIVTFAKGDMAHFATSLFTLAISFAPLWCERALKVRLPAWVHSTYVASIFFSMFAGEVFGLYGLIWQWDDMLHFVYGVLIGIGAVLWLSLLVRNAHSVRLPTWLQALFTVAIVVLVAVLWEIVEFVCDELFGTVLQANDLFDTMTDLIYGLGGGMVVAALLLLHLHDKRSMGLGVVIAHFQRFNH